MKRKLNVLIAASEVHPYAKTGGLADIAGSLPAALKQLGHEVRVIMPKYKSAAAANGGFESLGIGIEVPLGKTRAKGFLFQGCIHQSIPVYLIGHDGYYLRDGIYGEAGKDYPDNAERFMFFCRAILESCKALDFKPDILHLNDWQTGLTPAYLKTLYAKDAWFKNTRTLFTIHNLGYQGNFKVPQVKPSGLPPSCFKMEGAEFYNQFSFLKSGLVYSDILTTVSPNYSREIQSERFGFGMQGLLKTRSRYLFGILNGADYNEWNPASDPWLETPYSAKNMQGKGTCKNALEDLFSLQLDKKTPVVCMVTRLSEQKGIHLVEKVMPKLLKTGAAFVLLGTGDPGHEAFFTVLNKKHPGQCGGVIGFDEGLAHKILAGSDLLLMPSEYEPCGLTQMYAMKYGTVPLVHAVGGLKDTVKEFNPKTLAGTGFLFNKFNSPSLWSAVEKALSAYKNPTLWQRLVQNGMAEDFSWSQTAGNYSQLYFEALKK